MAGWQILDALAVCKPSTRFPLFSTHSQAGNCDVPFALHSFRDGKLLMRLSLHSFTGRELRSSVGFALMLSWPCHTDSTFGESNSQFPACE